MGGIIALHKLFLSILVPYSFTVQLTMALHRSFLKFWWYFSSQWRWLWLPADYVFNFSTMSLQDGGNHGFLKIKIFNFVNMSLQYGGKHCSPQIISFNFGAMFLHDGSDHGPPQVILKNVGVISFHNGGDYSFQQITFSISVPCTFRMEVTMALWRLYFQFCYQVSSEWR